MKQNNFMRIDKLPHHSSLFYELNFVSRRQFFVNIGKYASKMLKVRNDPLLYNKIFQMRASFPSLRRFLWRLVLCLKHAYVLRSSSTKSPFCPTSETPSGRIQCYVWFSLFGLTSFRSVKGGGGYSDNKKKYKTILLVNLKTDYYIISKSCWICNIVK